MKRFWLLLAVSMGLHLLLFPGMLSALMTSGAASQEQQTPKRIKIKLVKRKKRPAPPKKLAAVPKPVVKKKPVVRKQPKPVVKPKPVAKPKPKPVVKPKPRPKRVPKAKPRPRPKAKKAPPKRTRSKVPKARPRATTKSSVPKAKPRRGNKKKRSGPRSSNRRLKSDSKKTNSKRPGFTVPERPQPTGNSRAGVLPGEGDGSDEPRSDGTGTGSAGPARDGHDEPGEPVSSQPVPPPSPPPARPAPPTRPAERAPPPTPPPTPPPPKPKVPSSAPGPKARKARIEIATLKIPARLRQKSFKGSVKLRVIVQADGSATFRLKGSSGNKDVDDYILKQVNDVAVVKPALDSDGKPKKSVKTVRVDIEVD